MAKRSLRGLLRKKRKGTDKKAMTPQMRELMAAHTTAQHGNGPAQVKPGR